jgi:HEPN domain-containing protein
MKTGNENEAWTLLNDARQYREAADELFRSKRHLTCVINGLYFHVTELLLKSYMVAHGRKPRRTHQISSLYKKCSDLGLAISSNDRIGLADVVTLLEGGNEDMGFRYFNLKAASEPELNWTREVLEELERVVAAFVEPNRHVPPATGGKITMIVGKPQP